MLVRRRATLKIHAFALIMRSSLFWTNQQRQNMLAFLEQTRGSYSIGITIGMINTVSGDLLPFQKDEHARLTTCLS